MELHLQGNVNGSLFAPNFTAPDVNITDERLDITYSTDYGHRHEVHASIIRTDDGFTLVGAHAKRDGETIADTILTEVRRNDTRLAMLDKVANVDRLAAEFIAPQIIRELGRLEGAR
jgi:hypothetical protein